MTAELEQLTLIADYVKAVVALLALEATRDLTKKETVEKLLDAGLDTAVISDVTGIPKTTVGPIASRYKRNRA